MNPSKGKASSSGKGAKKSTRRASKLALKAARAKLRVEDLYEDPRSGYVSTFTQSDIDELFSYDSASDLSEDNYDKLAGDYDLLLNDVELLEAKEKLWNSEREALQKQISLLKLEYEVIQKKVTELESRLDTATNTAQAGTPAPSTKSLANATQAPDVIAPAITPAATEKKASEQCSKIAEKDSKMTEEQQTATDDGKPTQAKSSKKAIFKPAPKKPLSKKGQKRLTQDVLYVTPLQDKTWLDMYRELRGCAELLKEPFMIDRPRRVTHANGAEFLLVPIKRNADTAVVEKLVRESIGDLGKVTKKTPMTMITCKNLGVSTVAEDLQKAIFEKHGVNVVLANVQFQKSRKGKSQHALIKLSVRDSKKLDGRKLPIGTTTVTFQTELPKTTEEDRCFRCMGVGHRAPQCEETHSLCYRCGKDGHRAAECKNLPKCLTCDGGHPTGSRKCKKTSKPEEATVQASE
ncbi:uncharacterized protein LOC128303469 [Anopheles moucheti]|uniref:uncharacterized protein LOC128303469 n=1 Tax=Anopheles moucheti TaxID=186751 RepID=UPI0022EFDBC1|nr:uncharacterized protein LOC128303469 [Anopheles moucheti]